MALELQGIGERLRRAGYSVGKILSDTADSWEREGRIPHNLTDAYRPHEREDLWKVWRTIIAGDKDFKYQLGSGEIGSKEQRHSKTAGILFFILIVMPKK